MFIGLSSPVYDLSGAVVLSVQPASELFGFSRRVSRSTTLDGGVIITDNGFTDSDRTINVQLKPSLSLLQQISRILKTYPLLIVSTSDGCFRAACSALTEQGDGVVKIEFLVHSRLSA